MKKTLTISALALTVATLGIVAGQAQVPSSTSSAQVQEANWRGEGDWRKGRHGHGAESRFGRGGRDGGRHERGRRGGGRPGGDMMRQLQTFDANGDGAITQAEVDQFRQGQITQFDGNNDGTLSLEEYQALWLERMRERMVDAFQAHDDDGNGQVTAEEFNERFAELVERFDRNGDGQLNADDRRGNRRQGRQDAPSPTQDNAAPQVAPGATPAPTPQQ